MMPRIVRGIRGSGVLRPIQESPKVEPEEAPRISINQRSVEQLEFHPMPLSYQPSASWTWSYTTTSDGYDLNFYDEMED